LSFLPGPLDGRDILTRIAKSDQAWWWITPVIPATKDAEGCGLRLVWAKCRSLSEKSLKQKGPGGVFQVVECLPREYKE
jgi:hypothetical protein